VVRYASDERVGEPYRHCGEIRWFVFWPDAPFWKDAGDGAELLLAACVAQLDRWRVRRQYADGALPAPAVYGVPEQWPHVRAAYERAGFVPGRTEIVHLADLGSLRRPGEPPLPDLVLARSLGINGTRFSAVAAGDAIGYVEVATLDESERTARNAGFADVGNLEVVEAHRRRGVGSWLVAHAAEWLRLAHVDRLLAYSEPGEDDLRGFLEAVGFRELVRTERGWTRQVVRAS
jgi:GNAT superfamily N-acetyltransferase